MDKLLLVFVIDNVIYSDFTSLSKGRLTRYHKRKFMLLGVELMFLIMDSTRGCFHSEPHRNLSYWRKTSHILSQVDTERRVLMEAVVKDPKWLMWRPILIESKLSSGSVLIELSLLKWECIITQRQTLSATCPDRLLFRRVAAACSARNRPENLCKNQINVSTNHDRYS